MQVNSQELCDKLNPLVHENFDNIFAQNPGCTSNSNYVKTSAGKPRITAKWYKENGKMICKWIPM
ncbi:hypothetical protein NUACC21_80420 [Scytonema sp. NUACC21]